MRRTAFFERSIEAGSGHPLPGFVTPCKSARYYKQAIPYRGLKIGLRSETLAHLATKPARRIWWYYSRDALDFNRPNSLNRRIEG
jgi:hypothetical protein